MTRLHLTTIECLDQEHPGLADHVSAWLAEGIEEYDVAERLFRMYRVEISETSVVVFRSLRHAQKVARMLDRKMDFFTAIEALEADLGSELGAERVLFGTA